MTERSLFRLYRIYNVKYFGNRLPKPELMRFRRVYNGCAECDTQLDPETGQVRCKALNVHPVMKSWTTTVKTALLHEMIHVAVAPYDRHGGPFHRERLRLIRAGALDKLF